MIAQKMWHKPQATLLLLMSGALGQAQAICLNPFGCVPSTYEECRADAAGKPTERGVTIAVQNCERRFVTEPATRAAKEREDRLLRMWTAATAADDLEGMTRLLGEGPTDISHQGACTVKSEKTPPANVCVLARWRISDGEMRVSGATLLERAAGVESRRYLQVELVDARTRPLNGHWPSAEHVMDLPWR